MSIPESIPEDRELSFTCEHCAHGNIKFYNNTKKWAGEGKAPTT